MHLRLDSENVFLAVGGKLIQYLFVFVHNTTSMNYLYKCISYLINLNTFV